MDHHSIMRLMAGVRHLTMEELESGLDEIRQSPKDAGVLELIVRRPQTGAREVLEEGELDLVEGLVGTIGEPAVVLVQQTEHRIPTCSSPS
jgi:hypothetical protein